MEGVLQVVGEVGYRAASVRAVLEYSSGHRRQFYQEFESLEDCFAQAYAAWVERLGLNLLEVAVAVAGWRSQVRAALMQLFQFVVEKPQIARALFIEVHIAGGRALAAHDQSIERFAQALDSVREELTPDAAPPVETGHFVVGGIEAYVCEALSEGDPKRIRDGLPEVMRMVTGAYLDPRTAAEEAEATKAVLEESSPANRGEKG